MFRVQARSITWLAAGPVMCTFFSPGRGRLKGAQDGKT